MLLLITRQNFGIGGGGGGLSARPYYTPNRAAEVLTAVIGTRVDDGTIEAQIVRTADTVGSR